MYLDPLISSLFPSRGKRSQRSFENALERFDDLLGKVKELIREGNVTRIIVLNEREEQLFEIPVTFAAVGTLLAPQLAALGVIAALVTRPIIRIERKNKIVEE